MADEKNENNEPRRRFLMAFQPRSPGDRNFMVERVETVKHGSGAGMYARVMDDGKLSDDLVEVIFVPDSDSPRIASHHAAVERDRDGQIVRRQVVSLLAI